MGLYDLPVWLVTTLGAVGVLAYFSLIFYKENPWSRWVEYSVVGLGVGYGAVVTTWTLKGYVVEPLQAGDYSVLIPLIIGLLAYTQFTRRHRWPFRWTLAFTATVGLAISLTGLPLANFFVPIREIALPLLKLGSVFDVVNAIIALVGVVSVISYFTFTREHTGLIGIGSKIGRYFMMGTFGCGFGIALISQGTFLLNVLQFLLHDWLGIMPAL